jgi:hypothetical protein
MCASARFISTALIDRLIILLYSYEIACDEPTSVVIDGDVIYNFLYTSYATNDGLDVSPV